MFLLAGTATSMGFLDLRDLERQEEWGQGRVTEIMDIAAMARHCRLPCTLDTPRDKRKVGMTGVMGGMNRISI